LGVLCTHTTSSSINTPLGNGGGGCKFTNGRIIADSGEGYYNEADCDAGIAIVRGSRDYPTRKE
jgi:hypothetical protein